MPRNRKRAARQRASDDAVHVFIVLTFLLVLAFFIVAVAIRFLPAPGSPDDFCGASTKAACSSAGDCIAGGCSGQVCQGVSEPPAITTCEFRDCYTASSYALTCGCVQSKCQWTK